MYLLPRHSLPPQIDFTLSLKLSSSLIQLFFSSQNPIDQAQIKYQTQIKHQTQISQTKSNIKPKLPNKSNTN